jgi:hypothetical protein
MVYVTEDHVAQGQFVEHKLLFGEKEMCFFFIPINSTDLSLLILIKNILEFFSGIFIHFI